MLPTAQRDDDDVEEARAVAIAFSEFARKRKKREKKDAELMRKKRVVEEVALSRFTSLALVFFSIQSLNSMRRPRETRIALLAVVALLAVTGHRISSKRR